MQMIAAEHLGILSNFWWATVANDYSISFFLATSAIVTVLKILAVINPSVKSNDIVCLIQSWFYGIPGVKKENDKLKPDTSEIK